MMTPRMIAAIRFFQCWAGWITPPGRMQCARELAVAEAESATRGWAVVWSPDDTCYCAEDDVICRCDRERSEVESGRSRYWQCYCELAAIYSADDSQWARPLTVLGGICDPSPEYRRVVAAELAAELLAPERAELAQWCALLDRASYGAPTGSVARMGAK